MTETIKIAVCDDEKNIRSYLVSLIKKQGRECSITEYDSADAYLSDGKEHDILFLDIEMGGFGAGLDGMGLARHIRGIKTQKQPIIIFVTGYEKYVYDAFDVGAFQYLVKPVDEAFHVPCFVGGGFQGEKIKIGGVNIKVKGDVFHVTVMLQQGETGEDK